MSPPTTKNLSDWDFVQAVEYAQCYFDEVNDALRVLHEELETEGYQSKENFEDWRAINFAQRFPMYLSTLNLIRRENERLTDQLRQAIDLRYKERKEAKNA